MTYAPTMGSITTVVHGAAVIWQKVLLIIKMIWVRLSSIYSKIKTAKL